MRPADPGATEPASKGSTYLLDQRFRYTYASPVRSLRHRLVVVPPADHGGQRRLDHGLSVSGSAGVVSVRSDIFGNHVVEIRAQTVSDWVEFETWAVVAQPGPIGVTPVAPSSLTHMGLLEPTPLTRADAALVETARRLSAGDHDHSGLDLAERVCEWVHRSMTYEWGVTNVATTAAEALAGGRGVCQDYAHVMLAVCRAAGLPARYVSGHLVGEGGSHAWVEVMVAFGSHADAGGAVRAVAFDPTHGRRAGASYLTVAVGRDYADVAPTSGTFEGEGPGVLTTTKRLRSVASAEAGVRSGGVP